MDRDESTLPADASPEEECTWRWNEQQKEYTRNIMQNLLVEDVRVFEWRMNRFLSLPLIDSLREKQSNRIHFLVTVYETIRYFTSKPYLLCTDLLKIDNVVILGLVDAGILISRFNPSRLEVANELYRHLLSDFINVRYSALSLEEKATYNMNMLINQTAIRYHVDRLSDMQESPSTPPPQDQLRHCSRSPSEIP
ncbi:hypothetical protein CSUI_008219 [Cystoisospora suis]|uniref:Uncharacterized protein n=1 Tax=Cystoisospora suis TaxID=483139 RepID=A0A2C6KNJ6_9APIC|nr:hypothetical protein CSUI_008219 [Cystoisospora suis]